MKHRQIVGLDKLKKKSKKKTVKELNDNFSIFEEKLKSMEVLVDQLNAKVEFLEKTVEEPPHKFQNIHDESNTIDKEYSYKLCDFKCVKNKKLKVHLKEKHNKEINCKECDKRFDETFKLEIHLEMLDIKYCHYFNNKKHCPFEEVGYM